MREVDILDRLSIRAVCKTEDEIAEILDRIEGGTGTANSVKREAMRFRMNDAQCIVVYAPAGQLEPTAVLAPPRNLSTGGIAFLNDRYMTGDTRCVVYLRRLDGRWEGIEGVVLRCRYVESWMHEVSVKFKTPIEPDLYCRDACRRSVLLIEGDETQRALAEHYLSELNCEVTGVISGRDALEALRDASFDLIVCDADSSTNEEDREAIRGAAGGALLIALVDRQEVIERVREEGFVETIPRPITPGLMHSGTHSLLDALTKPFSRTGKVTELSVRIVEGMEIEVDQLRRSLDEGDFERFRRLLDSIEAQAVRLVRRELMSATERLRETLATGTAQQTGMEITRLATLCSEAREALGTELSGAPE